MSSEDYIDNESESDDIELLEEESESDDTELLEEETESDISDNEINEIIERFHKISKEKEKSKYRYKYSHELYLKEKPKIIKRARERIWIKEYEKKKD